MRLTVQTDYTLRVLIYLAVTKEDISTITTIATRYEISKNHLMKIAHWLAQKGYIESTRGRAGGLRLAYPTNKINIGHLIRELEKESPLVECFPNGKGLCKISPACHLQGILGKALDAFYKVLDQHTLADITSNQSELTKLLEELEIPAVKN